MSVALQTNIALPGQTGSPYVDELRYPSLAAGTYVVNESNFPGLTKYLPGTVCCVLSVTSAPPSAWIQATPDGGTTWLDVMPAMGYFMMDNSGTFRVRVVSTTDMTFYPMQ